MHSEIANVVMAAVVVALVVFVFKQASDKGRS